LESWRVGELERGSAVVVKSFDRQIITGEMGLKPRPSRTAFS
jgi:hypothetical protein